MNESLPLLEDDPMPDGLVTPDGIVTPDGLVTLACCFTGHRDIPADQRDYLGALLSLTVEELIAGGCRDFYCGGAIGFDTMAAVTVLNKKKSHPDIRLLLALPCGDQSARWRYADKVMYEKIKERADEVILLFPRYTPYCMAARNRYMVDHSGICVAYVSHRGGGSASTLAYAEKKGRRIINLANA